MRAVISESDRISQLQSCGAEFLRWGEPFRGGSTIVVIRCRNGHVREDTVRRILHSKGGCPHCANNTLVPEEKRISQITACGFTFLKWVELFKGAQTKALLRCSRGHEWVASVAVAIRGSGCKECHISSMRGTEEDCIERINSLGGVMFLRWVDGKYTNARSKADVRCDNGHVWRASVGNLVRGTRCPTCKIKSRSEARRIDEKECVLELNSSGFEFVRWESGYKNNKSKAVMRCKCGHEWGAAAYHIKWSKSGCPRCAPWGFNPGKPGTLYLLRSADGSACKIGISNNHEKRLDQLRKSTPFQWDCIELLHSDDGGFIAYAEKAFHAQTEQETFNCKFDGFTEWRVWKPEIRLWFKEWQELLMRTYK